MNKNLLVLLITVLTFITSNLAAQEKKEKETPKIDTRIDNMGYWKRMAKEGFVPVEPVREIPKAVIKGSKINGPARRKACHLSRITTT